MSNTKTDRTAHLQNLNVYTLTELEPILGVTHRTLLTYVKTGKLKAVKIGDFLYFFYVKIGGKYKVSEENLKKFINGEE